MEPASGGSRRSSARCCSPASAGSPTSAASCRRVAMRRWTRPSGRCWRTRPRDSRPRTVASTPGSRNSKWRAGSIVTRTGRSNAHSATCSRSWHDQTDDLAFYRSIVSPADGIQGLRIQRFDVTQGARPREFVMKLTLVQAMRHDKHHCRAGADRVERHAGRQAGALHARRPAGEVRGPAAVLAALFPDDRGKP